MMKINKILVGIVATIMFSLMAIPVFAANPSADGNCSEIVTDPYLGQGTRADLYNCKPIGNSGEEQGIYFWNNAPATLAGYPASGDYSGYEFDVNTTCDILVKWSGDYGPTPSLDFGTVFNNTRCSNGYVEIWGDNFGTNDPYGSTPYVYSIGGIGSLIHP